MFEAGISDGLAEEGPAPDLAAADELAIPAMMSNLAFHLYRTAQADGLGKAGNHALVKAYERLSGVVVDREPKG